MCKDTPTFVTQRSKLREIEISRELERQSRENRPQCIADLNGSACMHCMGESSASQLALS